MKPTQFEVFYRFEDFENFYLKLFSRMKLMQRIEYVLYFFLALGVIIFAIEWSSAYVSNWLNQNFGFSGIIFLVLTVFVPAILSAILLFFGGLYYLKIKYFAIMLEEFADAVSTDKWYVYFKPFSFRSIMDGRVGYVAGHDGKSFIISRIISASYYGSKAVPGTNARKSSTEKYYIHQAIENSNYKNGFEYIDHKTLDGLFPSKVTNYDKGIIFPHYRSLPLEEEIKKCKSIIFKNLYACFKN